MKRRELTKMGTKRGQIQIACLLGSLILFSGLALVLKGPAPTSTEPALAKTAPDARASASQRLGKAMWGPAEVNGVSQFPTYKDLGVGIYQMAIDWSQIAATRPATATDPADPAYQWPEHFEKTILEANRYGMQVTMMVIGAPAWANGGHSDRAWTPKNPKDYADFVTAMSRKYPRVRFWMIWGEPNRSPNFKPLTPSRTGPLNAAQARAPRNYARILDAAYVALKKVDSRDLVIGGNTFTAAGRDSISTYQWIRYMRLPNGGRPRMDLYGHNPFGFRIPSLANKPSPRGMVDFSDSKRLTKVLDRYYPRKRFRLFLSEWGVPAGATEDAELGYKLNYATQARWIKAGLRLSRKFKRIYTIGWIHPYDRPELGIITGLLKADGRKKPGYFSFRNG